MMRLAYALSLSAVLVGAGTATAGPWRSRGGCGAPVAVAPVPGGCSWNSPGWTSPTWGKPDAGPGRILYAVPPAPLGRIQYAVPPAPPGRFLPAPAAEPTRPAPLVMPPPKPVPDDKK